MFCEKLILMTTSQRKRLEDIQKNIEKNGGQVSANQLIRDSIQIFLDHYRDKAIQNYSPAYD